MSSGPLALDHGRQVRLNKIATSYPLYALPAASVHNIVGFNQSTAGLAQHPTRLHHKTSLASGVWRLASRPYLRISLVSSPGPPAPLLRVHTRAADSMPSADAPAPASGSGSSVPTQSADSPKPAKELYPMSNRKYDTFLWFMSIFVDLFFREVHPRGSWKVPRQGPVLFVAAPHANQVSSRLPR